MPRMKSKITYCKDIRIYTYTKMKVEVIKTGHETNQLLEIRNKDLSGYCH
jgi:hypothetical protein